MKKKKTNLFIQYFVLFVIAILFILPMLWLIMSSIDLHANPMIKFPSDPTLANYISVLQNPDNIRGFLNSLILAVVTSLLTISLSVLASYPLSRYKLRGKTKLLYTILFMTSLPINAILVPIFKLFISFDLQNNLLSLALFMTATQLPYGIWMTKNFMDSVPVSLEEAAKVDGANSIQAMQKIIMPLMKPGIFTVLIYVFTGVWGNFFVPFILLQSPEKYPASVRIYQFFQSTGLIEYGNLAAYSVIYMIPSVILYAFAQKYMSKGFSFSGADKG
jgi:multiple sugar transport system permease protein